jgi:hypothetical protein
VIPAITLTATGGHAKFNAVAGESARSGGSSSAGGSKSNDQALLANISYDEAVRTITQQRSALDELRTRTGTLLSASAISTAFLGSVAAQGHPGLPLVFLWAMAPFSLSIVLCIYLLLFRGGWSFALRSTTILEFPDASPKDIWAELAKNYEDSWFLNQRRLNLQSKLFGAAAILMLWSILAWIVLID